MRRGLALLALFFCAGHSAMAHEEAVTVARQHDLMLHPDMFTIQEGVASVSYGLPGLVDGATVVASLGKRLDAGGFRWTPLPWVQVTKSTVTAVTWYMEGDSFTLTLSASGMRSDTPTLNRLYLELYFGEIFSVVRVSVILPDLAPIGSN